MGRLLRTATAMVALTGLVPAANAVASDLTYSPVEPCRIVDTRSSFNGNLQSLVPQSFVAFGAAGELTAQGGNPIGCEHPKSVEGLAPVAISANIAAVAGQATGNGDMVAYPTGSAPPTATVINFYKGTNLSNSTIISLCEGDDCTFDFDMMARFATVPVVVDVQGYFYQLQIRAEPKVIDSNDNVLGDLLGMRLKTNVDPANHDSLDSNYITVLTPTGFYTEISQSHGTIHTSVGTNVYFTQPSCAGQGYVLDKVARGTVGHIGTCNDCAQNALYSVPLDAANAVSPLRSYSYSSSNTACAPASLILNEQWIEAEPNNPSVTGIPNPSELINAAPYRVSRNN